MQTLIFKIKCYKEWLSMNKNGPMFTRKFEIPKQLKFFIQDNLIKISSNIFSAQSVGEEEKSSLQIKQICSFIVSEERKFQCFWADTKKMLWQHLDCISSNKQSRTDFDIQNQSDFATNISNKISQLMEIGIELSNKLIAQMKHVKQKKPDRNTMQILKTTLQNNLQSSQRSVIFPDLDIKKQDSFIENYVIPEQNPNEAEDMVVGRFITQMDSRSTIEDCQETKQTQVPKKQPKNNSNNRLKRLVQQTIDKANFQGFNFEKKKRYNYFYGECSFQNPQINKKQQIIKSAEKINQVNETIQNSQPDFYIPQHKNAEKNIKEKIKASMKHIKSNQQKAEKITQKFAAQYVRVNYKDNKKPSFLSPKTTQVKICDQLDQIKYPFNEKKPNSNSPNHQNVKINIFTVQQDKQNPELFKKNGKKAQSIDISNQGQQNTHSLDSIRQNSLIDNAQKVSTVEKKKLFVQRLANIDEYAKTTSSMYKPQERNSTQTSNEEQTVNQSEKSQNINSLDINLFQQVSSQLFFEQQHKKIQDYTTKNSLIIIDDIMGSWESRSQISFGAQ